MTALWFLQNFKIFPLENPRYIVVKIKKFIFWPLLIKKCPWGYGDFYEMLRFLPLNKPQVVLWGPQFGLKTAHFTLLPFTWGCSEVKNQAFRFVGLPLAAGGFSEVQNQASRRLILPVATKQPMLGLHDESQHLGCKNLVGNP